MNENYIQWLIDHQAKYQVRYVDNSEGQFTVPIELTEDRAERLFDHSIIEVRFIM